MFAEKHQGTINATLHSSIYFVIICYHYLQPWQAFQGTLHKPLRGIRAHSSSEPAAHPQKVVLCKRPGVERGVR